LPIATCVVADQPHDHAARSPRGRVCQRRAGVDVTVREGAKPPRRRQSWRSRQDRAIGRIVASSGSVGQAPRGSPVTLSTSKARHPCRRRERVLSIASCSFRRFDRASAAWAMDPSAPVRPMNTLAEAVRHAGVDSHSRPDRGQAARSGSLLRMELSITAPVRPVLKEGRAKFQPAQANEWQRPSRLSCIEAYSADRLRPSC